MRRQKRRFILTSAVLGLMAGAPASVRAEITTSNAEGTYDDGTMLGGNLTIDTTSGKISSADLTLTGIPGISGSINFTQVAFQSPNDPQSGAYYFTVSRLSYLTDPEF